MKNAYFILLTQLLKAHNYALNEKELALRFLSDPDNLVLSFTNTLDYFKIEHVTANVPKTALQQLPKSFIAQVNNGKSEPIVLVTKKSNKTIQLQLSEKKIITLSENQFLSDWTGFVIAIEENNAPIRKALSKKTIIPTTLLILSLILIAYIYNVTSSILLSIYFALALVGSGLSYLIVKEKIGKATFASKYCKISSSTSCENVLNSKSAKIYKGFDLSDAVVIYFTFLSVTFLIQSSSILFFIFSVGSLPIIIYSIYQQYVTIKKWCLLCLGVALILALQFVTFLPIYKNTLFAFNHILLFSAVASCVTIIWLSLKPLTTLEQKHYNLEVENLSFRRNYHLFIPYYNTLSKIDTEDNVIPQVTLGAKNPLIKLTIITNPLCKSCIDAHKTYMDILSKFEDNIQLNFRFLIPSKDRTDAKTIISERLLQLYFENDSIVFLEAFNDWYNTLDVKKWTKKWGTCEDLKFNKIITQHIHWCLKNTIVATPALLINNRLFPQNYSTEDITHFIEPILEKQVSYNKQDINNIHA